MYLVLILTHKRNLSNVHTKHWLQRVNVPYVIVYGDTTIEHDFLYNTSKSELVVKCPDTYEYLTLKLACAYKWIVTVPEMQDVQGVFKVDDDVVVNVHELHNLIETPIVDDYSGHVHLINESSQCSHHQSKVTDPHLKTITFSLQLSKICYGPMYYLSRRALQAVVSKFSYQNFSIYSTQLFEDYTFGNLLKRSGIEPVCIRMYTDHLEQFVPYNFIAFHDQDHTQPIDQIDRSINN